MTTRGAIGVDLGGTNLRAAYVEVDGHSARIVEQRRQPVGDVRDPQAVVSALAELVRSVAPERRLPVGIGVAGMLRGTGGIIANAPNLGWRDVPLGTMVASALGRPVWVENDLSAICWGEYRFGGAQGHRHVVCVFVGTGVGGGGVLEGRPYRGAGNVALEIGHVKVASLEQGRACGCGQRGCLEAYAGGRSLALQAQELATPLLLEQVDGAVEALHGGHLDEAARGGCAESAAVIERAGRYLGGVLATATTLLNPSCLLVGGTVWQGSPRLRELAQTELEAQTTPPALPWMRLCEAQLGDDAGVLGAADLALVQGIEL
jgi:glucokinase